MEYKHPTVEEIEEFEQQMAKGFEELEVGVLYESPKGTQVILTEKVGGYLYIFKHVNIDQVLKVDIRTANYRYYRLRKIKKVYDAPVQETQTESSYDVALNYIKTCGSVTFESYTEFVTQLGVTDAATHLRELMFNVHSGKVIIESGLISLKEISE